MTIPSISSQSMSFSFFFRSIFLPISKNNPISLQKNVPKLTIIFTAKIYSHMSFMEEIPTSILSEILSRLPIKTILQSMSVCKSWHNLLSDSHFAKIHLSRSPNSLMIHQWGFSGYSPGYLRLLEVKDENDHHCLHHQNPTMNLDLTLGAPLDNESDLLLVGSVNGWLCLWQRTLSFDNTYICNPITREYLILPKPQYYKNNSHAFIIYGFGYSFSTGQYKVVRIFTGKVPSNESTGEVRSCFQEAEIYTIGTGTWRSLGQVPYWLDEYHGPFLNGFVHWMNITVDSPSMICSFDMEREFFDFNFPSPPKSEEADLLPDWDRYQTLGVMRGCLCKCDDFGPGLDIWVMKEYGIQKSWSKDFVVKNSAYPDRQVSDPFYVRKGFKDGSILFTCNEVEVYEYCPKREDDIVSCNEFGYCANAIDFAPSFLRLGNFELESVHSFD